MAKPINTPPATPSPAHPAPPVRPRWKRLLRRAFIIFAIAFLLLLAVFFLIPVWMSNEQGRDYVLERLNKRLAGSAPNLYEANAQVLVDKWTLGWFRPTELVNLRIQRPDGTVILSAPRVHSGLTLWDIFWRNYDLRNTTASNLHFAVTKYADGRSSLDLLTGASGAEDLLRTVRGALQINGGEVSVTSAITGETIRYNNIRADVSIGSVDAPVYLRASATGTADAPNRPTVTGDLSINATLPPVRSMSIASYWSYLQDIEFAATNVPSGLFLDCLGIDPAWGHTLGHTLDYVRFTNHASSGEGRPVLLVQGKPNGPHDPTPAARIDARLEAGRDTIRLPAKADENFQLDAALRMSPMLAGLLRHLHPLLGDVDPQMTGIVRLNTYSLHLPTNDPGSAEMTARLTFPLLSYPSLDDSDPESFHATLGTFLGRLPPDVPLKANPSPLQFRIAGRTLWYENFLVEFQNPPPGGTRMNFSGSTTFPGQLDLVTTIRTVSGPRGSLSSGTTQILIQGTIDRPLFRRAQ